MKEFFATEQFGLGYYLKVQLNNCFGLFNDKNVISLFEVNEQLKLKRIEPFTATF